MSPDENIMKMPTQTDVVLTSSTKYFVEKSDEAYNVVLILVAKPSMIKLPRFCSSLMPGSCNFQFRVAVNVMSLVHYAMLLRCISGGSILQLTTV
jgi:hypothetical protein